MMLHEIMIHSQQIELEIYKHIKRLGPGRVSTALAVLAAATGENRALIVERLKSLEAENRIALSKYSGGNRWPRTDFHNDDSTFFYAGSFLIEIIPQARRYFEELEEMAEAEAEKLKPRHNGAEPIESKRYPGIWNWPAIAFVASVLMGFGGNAVYGGDYIAAIIMCSLGSALLVAKLLTWNKAAGLNHRVVNSLALLAAVVFTLWVGRTSYIRRPISTSSSPTSSENKPASSSAKNENDSTKNQRRIYIVLLDLSPSVRPASRSDAIGAIKNLVFRMEAGDKLVIVPMTENAATQTQGSVLRYQLSFPELDHVFARARVQTKERLGDEIVASLNTLQGQFGRQMSSDLLGALEVCSEEIALAQSFHPVLILLSDFIQEGNNINFAGSSELTGATSAKIYADRVAEQFAGQKAHHPFQGVQVYLGYLRTVRPLQTERRTAIQLFWSEFFSVSGAHVTKAIDGPGEIDAFVSTLP